MLEATRGSTSLKKTKGGTLHWDSSWEGVADRWESLPAEEHFFMSSTFCKTVARATLDESLCLYVVVERNGEVIMKAFAQIVKVDLLQSLSEESDVRGLYHRLMRRVRRGITRKLNGYLLNFGHLVLSGERGFVFDESLSLTQRVLLIQEVSLRLFQHISRVQKLEVVLVKDLHERYNFDAKNPLSCQFSGLSMPPAMYVRLQPEWLSLDDYMSTFKSKYRVRVRKAMKRSEGLRYEQMDLEVVKRHETRLHQLYSYLADDAVFNLFSLSPHYFALMIEGLGDRFVLYGIWDEEELIGFYSAIIANTIVEAHFVGYDPAYVKSHDVYLNILIRYIQETLEHRKEYVFFARTAEEIKSSVGASPIRYRNYLRHRQLIPNQIIPIILHNIMPEEQYALRDPFKK